MMIRVMVVDDQELMRSGLRLILDAAPDIEVVGEASDGQEAVDLVPRCRPDVVLLDIRMPGVGGIEATSRFRAMADGPQVLILTTYDLDEHLWDAVRAGAAGFMLKTAPPTTLIEAVRTIAHGEAVVAPAITRRLLDQFAEHPPPGRPPEILERLSARERDVFLLLARGLDNTEIGAQLFLSVATVKTHVNSLLRKLEVRTRVQAVVLAHESGVLDSAGPQSHDR